jgi:hypothetical protein
MEGDEAKRQASWRKQLSFIGYVYQKEFVFSLRKC